ncbi:SET and MYND domaincontaining protein 4like, partial [Caligus rogercresseyi]
CGYTSHLQSKSIGRMALLAYRPSSKRIFLPCSQRLRMRSDFAAVYDQISHEDVRDPGEIFKRICVAIFIANQPDISEFILTTLRLLQSNSCNAYEVNELTFIPLLALRRTQSLEEQYMPLLALATIPALYNLGVLRAATIINPGDEITDNYGHYYLIK